ncbi:hypothetical protein [Enterococcus faecium]|uniref:hypothetical protein n=1 Tax=Enterococcus faecium TaxID=1352 RepID=UPI001D0BE9FC|nr:hypothetical protein [Enterococcus faecium]
MDKVETLVNILAAITSIILSIVNYKFKVASKKSEEKAETSKKEIQEIEKSVKEEVQRGIQEKARFHEYSSIETELKSMRTKLGTGFESIPRTRFVRIFSRFQRVSISSFRPAVKPKPFDR